MATVIAYVDGFNLYHGLHDMYGRRYLWLDLQHLVADAAASASDIALIVSADSDLCPAIRTARSLNPRRRMIAAFPPRRSSFEIRSLIRKPFTLAAADIRNSLLPGVVADPATGLIHKRPDKWR